MVFFFVLLDVKVRTPARLLSCMALISVRSPFMRPEQIYADHVVVTICTNLSANKVFQRHAKLQLIQLLWHPYATMYVANLFFVQFHQHTSLYCVQKLMRDMGFGHVGFLKKQGW